MQTYLLAASLVPCLRTGFPLYGCAMVTLGDFHETGVSLVNPRSGDAFFAAVGPRLGASVPLASRVSLYVNADALFVLVRHPVTIDGAPVFTQSVLAATVGIGTRVRF